MHLAPALFSSDPDAVKIREECDYSQKITMENAKNPDYILPRPIRIYADGIFDLFHTSHSEMFRQAKFHFGEKRASEVHLIVGVSPDEETHAKKGITVYDENTRYDSVAHSRYVDEVVRGCPWVITQEFIDEYKIDFVAHDDLPYGSVGQNDIYKFVKDKNMFIGTKRGPISTTDTIVKIIANYDLYLMRSLKRGLTHNELNISFLKEQQLKMKDNYDRASDFVKEFVSSPARWVREKIDNLIGHNSNENMNNENGMVEQTN